MSCWRRGLTQISLRAPGNDRNKRAIGPHPTPLDGALTAPMCGVCCRVFSVVVGYLWKYENGNRWESSAKSGNCDIYTGSHDPGMPKNKETRWKSF